MKFIFLSIIFTAIAARADLVMKEQMIHGSLTNFETTIIHGNNIRQDHSGGVTGDTSSIWDADTGDSAFLSHQKKTFKKTSGASGAQLRERLKYNKKQSGNSNTADAMPKKLVDTGKSEKIGGYDANIFTWPLVDGPSTTYWIAKGYPNYEKIKVDLAKLDHVGAQFLGVELLPKYEDLPGMVMKLQIVQLVDKTNAWTATTTLISVKEEPVDPSIFEIPKDYKELTTPANQPASPIIPHK
jgi:hypothetical protein